MTEPIYEFVKGEGWVVKTHDFIYAQDRDGIPVRLVRRRPNEGEPFFFGLRDMTQDINHVGNYALSQFSLWDNTRWHYAERELITVIEVL